MGGRYHWLGAAVLAVVAAGAVLVWIVRPDDAAPDPGGIVQLNMSETPVPQPSRKPMPAAAADSTVIATLAPPADLAARLRSEARDRQWAERSEQAIRTNMAGFAFLGGAPLTIECAATLCEVRGTAKAESTDAVKLMWQELELFTQGDALTAAGLLSAAATFGTADSPYAFVLHYRRNDAPPGRR